MNGKMSAIKWLPLSQIDGNEMLRIIQSRCLNTLISISCLSLIPYVLIRAVLQVGTSFPCHTLSSLNLEEWALGTRL